jgi:hypothetical protein
MSIKGLIGKMLIWIDIKVNDYLLFGKNETMSARMGRSLESDNPHPLAEIICGFLDIAERQHCRKAYAALLKKRANENATNNSEDSLVEDKKDH